MFPGWAVASLRGGTIEENATVDAPLIASDDFLLEPRRDIPSVHSQSWSVANALA